MHLNIFKAFSVHPGCPLAQNAFPKILGCSELWPASQHPIAHGYHSVLWGATKRAPGGPQEASSTPVLLLQGFFSHNHPLAVNWFKSTLILGGASRHKFSDNSFPFPEVSVFLLICSNLSLALTTREVYLSHTRGSSHVFKVKAYQLTISLQHPDSNRHSAICPKNKMAPVSWEGWQVHSAFDGSIRTTDSLKKWTQQTASAQAIKDQSRWSTVPFIVLTAPF